jgi:hypothetical protein
VCVTIRNTNEFDGWVGIRAMDLSSSSLEGNKRRMQREKISNFVGGLPGNDQRGSRCYHLVDPTGC